MMEPMTPCWECLWHKSYPTNLLGNCQWFVSKGQEAKQIPANVVDVGCKYWQKKETSGLE